MGAAIGALIFFVGLVIISGIDWVIQKIQNRK
jgi:hypothetical protein